MYAVLVSFERTIEFCIILIEPHVLLKVHVVIAITGDEPWYHFRLAVHDAELDC